MSEASIEHPWTDEVCKDWEENVFFRRAIDSGDLKGYIVAHMDSAPPAVKEYRKRQVEFAKKIKIINVGTGEIVDTFGTDR